MKKGENRFNKRGQNITIGTIILIVLGIAVLVFLIFGFSTGWNNLWNKVTDVGGGSNNVNSIKQGCAIACSTQDIDSYCKLRRNVNFGDDRTNIKGSCENLNDIGITCGDFECPESNTYKQSCSDIGGEWKATCGEGESDKFTNKVKNDGRTDEDKAKKPMCCTANA